MDRKRKAYAPFSQTSEAGVAQTPVEGYIDVNQTIYPTVNTGVVDEKGTWNGIKSSDREFFGFTKAEAIAGNSTFITPDTNQHQSIDMRGFTGLQIAVFCSRSINIKLEALSGPDTEPTANLKPVTENHLRLLKDNSFDSTETLNA